jgi:hypothetical protein
VKPVLLGWYGCIFHGTGNSAQLCQNFGISGVEPPPPPAPNPPVRHRHRLVVTDVSGQHMGPNVKGPTSRHGTSVTNFQFTPRYTKQEQRRFQLCHDVTNISEPILAPKNTFFLWKVGNFKKLPSLRQFLQLSEGFQRSRLIPVWFCCRPCRVLSRGSVAVLKRWGCEVTYNKQRFCPLDRWFPKCAMQILRVSLDMFCNGCFWSLLIFSLKE